MNTPIPATRLSSFYFTYYAALGAFTPYWSLYLKDSGQDAAAIGILMSLWYATRMIAPTAWNWLATKTTRPVQCLYWGCAITIACFCGFLYPWGFNGLFVAMCLFCFFYNAVMPQFEAITLSHLIGAPERYGAIRVWGSLGFIATVGIFGVVLDHVAVRWLPLLMLPLFGAMFGSSLLNDYGAGQREKIAVDSAEFRRRLRRPDVIAFFVVCLLTQISFGPLYTFFALYLEQHGYRPSTLGTFWAIGVAVEVAVFFLSSRLFVRWSAHHVVVVAVGSAAVRWLATAWFPDNVLVMTLAQLTHAINFAAFFAGCMQLMARYFPGPLGGYGQGVFYGFSSGVGGALGALIAGQAWRLGGGKLAFEVAAAFSLVAAIVAWRWLRPPVEPRPT